jgi:DNA-directed RNA polymerase specialized sigma24 family protein
MEGGGGHDRPSPPSSAITRYHPFRERRVEEENPEKFSEEEEEKLASDCLPPYEGERLPPELRDLPRLELRLAMKAALAHVANKAHSTLLAEEMVQDVFVKVTHTRRWNSAKGPFSRHFMLCTKSELSHHFESKAREKEAEAREGYGREELPSATASVEESVILAETEEEEAAARESTASREMALLRDRTSGHELIARLLDCYERGIEKPRHVAAELGVPVEKVYDAVESLRRHLRKIRESEAQEKK